MTVLTVSRSSYMGSFLEEYLVIWTPQQFFLLPPTKKNNKKIGPQKTFFWTPSKKILDLKKGKKKIRFPH